MGATFAGDVVLELEQIASELAARGRNAAEMDVPSGRLFAIGMVEGAVRRLIVDLATERVAVTDSDGGHSEG